MNTQPHNAENGETGINKLIADDDLFKKQYGFNKADFDFSHPRAFVKSLSLKTGLKDDEIGILVETIEMFIFNSPMTKPSYNGLYTKQQVLSMLESLRQRCAKHCDSMELSPRAHKNRIEAIDLNQFLPPLNK